MNKEKSFLIDGKSLYLEKNIVTVDIPLLFTCVDDDKNKYVVLCTDSDNLTYLVAKTNARDLIEMLQSETSLREPFKKSSKLWFVKAGIDVTKDEVKKIYYEKILEEDLPKKGARLEFSNESIRNYIDELESEIGSHYEKIVLGKVKYYRIKLEKKNLSFHRQVLSNNAEKLYTEFITTDINSSKSQLTVNLTEKQNVRMCLTY